MNVFVFLKSDILVHLGFNLCMRSNTYSLEYKGSLESTDSLPGDNSKGDMYNIENAAQPDTFHNAFDALWWAIATLTTVGYGDIYPITAGGRILSSIIAVLGIGLVAVPTGIISAGFMEEIEVNKHSQEHDEKCFCPYCGHKLDE